MIKALVVDDSPVAREFISYLLESSLEITVIGKAKNGEEAFEFLRHNHPNVVTMDIHMPGMNGIEITRRIMETRPVPIVIVSGNWDPTEVETTFRAMDAGAVAIVQRPRGIGHPDHDRGADELVRTVKLMSEIKVVRRWSRRRSATALSTETKEAAQLPMPQSVRVVALGASTGGPPVLKTILDGLDKDFPAALLVVQHIAAGFLKGMAEWLSETSAVPVTLAADGERLVPGRAYFAPDNFNMGVDKDNRIKLRQSPDTESLRPSVGYLFRSVAEIYGKEAVGVLLTGMGRDGAEELKLMKDKGALTIAQDKESSIIFGMPGAAVEIGAATYVLPPEKIAAVLRRLSKSQQSLGSVE